MTSNLLFLTHVKLLVRTVIYRKENLDTELFETEQPSKM